MHKLQPRVSRNQDPRSFQHDGTAIAPCPCRSMFKDLPGVELGHVPRDHAARHPRFIAAARLIRRLAGSLPEWCSKVSALPW
jgi:hypothetical protein